MSLNLSNKNIEDFNNYLPYIKSPEQYTSLDLSNNLLSFLPKDLSMFKSLISLNIINNNFTNYNSLAQSLSSLPLLHHLNIDLATQENVIIILTALPELITLNGENTGENSSCYSDNHVNINNKKREISLNEETNEFEFIYKEINNDEFNKKFQKKLREEINKINNNLDISNILYNAIIVKSKLEIYSFILDEIINIIFNTNNQVLNKNEKIIEIINLVKDKIKYNQNILFELIMNNNNDNNNNNYKKNISYELSNEITVLDSINNTKIKIIPKNELINIIDQLYEYYIKNKEKNDINLESIIIPFLTAKFGLKSIANFWNKKIFESINFYLNNNEQDFFSEIYLIKKILEKKIDEFFYIKYKRIKMKYINYLNNIDNLLGKNNKEIINYEDGIKLLIDNLNDINDNSELDINDILELFNKRKNNINENNNENIMEILCNDFINILLELQIKRRENQYNIFFNKFKIYDKNDDGYINKEEFIEMIYSFKNEYFYNDNKIISKLCSESFQSNKIYISINNCIEILSKTNINNKNIFDILLSFS